MPLTGPGGRGGEIVPDILFYLAPDIAVQLMPVTYWVAGLGSTLCRVAECNKMWPCRAANNENNVDVNAAQLRQGFWHAMRHENLLAKCQSHQRFASRHMMSKELHNYIS